MKQEIDYIKTLLNNKKLSLSKKLECNWRSNSHERQEQIPYYRNKATQQIVKHTDIKYNLLNSNKKLKLVIPKLIKNNKYKHPTPVKRVRICNYLSQDKIFICEGGYFSGNVVIIFFLRG